MLACDMLSVRAQVRRGQSVCTTKSCTSTKVCRLQLVKHCDRTARKVAVKFRRSRSWAPSFETIDEASRKKRLQITLRFEDADRDNNGRIDKEELRTLLESSACSQSTDNHLLEHWLTDAELDRLMRFYDMDGSGDLDEPEFQRLVNDGLLLDEKLADYQAAFTAVDTDSSGDVSAQELAQVMDRLGWPEQKCAVEQMQHLINRYGANSAGNLDFTSFMALIKEEMLDVREVLAYLGATQDRPHTTRAVIHAVADESFSLVSSEDHLDTALMRAGDRLVLMMAGTTWCEKSRHMVQHVKALAAVYPSLVVLMLWGNVNSNAKALFRDQLMVRSTPAFFMFRHSELICHWAADDAARLELEIRRRMPLDPDMPALPIYYKLEQQQQQQQQPVGVGVYY